jgi:hypothetical protein
MLKSVPGFPIWGSSESEAIMKKILLALVGVLALLGSAVAAPVDAKGPPEKDRAVSAETSGTRTRTLVCDGTGGFTYTVDNVLRVEGARGLGTGTLVTRLEVNPNEYGWWLFSGTLTFTSDDGSNTLTGVHSGIGPVGGIPYDTTIYYPTSGTGRFGQVTGGELTLSSPHSGPGDCGETIVDEVAGFVDGFLTYNGPQD